MVILGPTPLGPKQEETSMCVRMNVEMGVYKWLWKKSLLLLSKGGRQPVQALVQALGGGGDGGLDVPFAVADAMEAQSLGDFRGGESLGEILLVSENKEDGIAELLFVEHLVKLVVSIFETLVVITIHHEDDTVGVLVVMAPEGADLVLSTYIPNGEGDVLVLNSLNVETDGGDGGHNLAKLELLRKRV